MKHLLVSRPTPTFSGRATNAGLQKEGAITRDKSRKTMGKLRFVTFSDSVPAALEKKNVTTQMTKERQPDLEQHPKNHQQYKRRCKCNATPLPPYY